MKFLDKKIDEEINNGVFPGMTYSIINNDKKYIGYEGYMDYDNKQKVSNNTLYDVASLTKVISIVPIITKLIDSNELKYGDKIKKYLSKFMYDDVTIYDMLVHQSGLPGTVKGENITSENILNKIYNQEKVYETGKDVVYSDIAYILLGKLLEEIYKESLDVISKKEVFIPLNMKDTCFNPTNKDNCAPTELTENRGLIQGVVHDWKGYLLNGVAGHAGVFTNADDIANFMQMILNNGVYDGKQFISKENIDILFKSLVYEKANDRTRSLCWITRTNDLVINGGDGVMSFTGFTGPSISFDRNNGIAIALMTNRTYPTRNNKKLSIERPEITNEIYKKLVKTR